jgi:hypothetical protein
VVERKRREKKSNSSEKRTKQRGIGVEKVVVESDNSSDATRTVAETKTKQHPYYLYSSIS